MIEAASQMKTMAKPETELVAETASGEEMKFRIIHWSPSKVFQRISIVGKYFYVPVSMIASIKPEDPNFADAIPGALLQLFNTMEENDFIGFLATMLDDVYYKNAPVVQNFDTVFLGKNEVVLQVVAKVLEVNYGPFFKTGFANLMTSIVPVANMAKTD